MSLANVELAKIISIYLEVSYDVRRQGDRVDIQAQSLAERIRLVRFLSTYPLQSYKHSEFKLWRKYVMALEHDSRINRQRQTIAQDRSDFYYALREKLQRMQTKNN